MLCCPRAGNASSSPSSRQNFASSTLMSDDVLGYLDCRPLLLARKHPWGSSECYWLTRGHYDVPPYVNESPALSGPFPRVAESYESTTYLRNKVPIKGRASRQHPWPRMVSHGGLDGSMRNLNRPIDLGEAERTMHGVGNTEVWLCSKQPYQFRSELRTPNQAGPARHDFLGRATRALEESKSTKERGDKDLD
ncbi:hypothetical protein BDZ45DRAFT_699563 [Acephala macrosclerotiorum]|nr:hypothetical protein BDZ45DRAFT_699563 [Acephala macrosclerotiorum]